MIDAITAVIENAGEEAAWALWQVVLTICVTATTLAGGATVFWWLVKPRLVEWARREVTQPIQETHRSVTVNGGTSTPPTLRDDVVHLRSEVRQIATIAGAHSQRFTDLGDRIDDLAELGRDTRDDLARHIDDGTRYLGVVRLALSEQGVDLPEQD